MARRLLFLLSVIFFSSSVSGEEQMIRQVVDGSSSSSAAAAASDDLVLNAELHFSNFMRTYGKSYSGPEEHAHRLSVFRRNMRRARRHQRLDPTAVHGVTQFSDLTPGEFKRTYLGLRRKGRGKSAAGSAHEAPILPTNDLPEDFDWRDKGAVTAVKNQGSCGSCWSFSTSGALEGANFLATGKLETLSEQQMVDCDHECDPDEPDACDQGCNGGLMNTAFEYLQKVGGLESEKDYPYTGTDRGTCKFDKSKIKASVHNFSVVSIDEEQIAANLVKHGPLAVAINAVFMQTYIGGVSCPYICGRHLDHGVLLVGYGSAGYAPIRLKEKPYWIIKNSWGETWGENGYYKICRGRNVCGVDSMVSTVTAIHTTAPEA
ncbi:cysteine proteinase 1-like [Iris pallida]|uniref:Cysteine proteinase 1-like n=1 Tax=Iris pallida TaxID=29817 RepID=A0AAX6HQ33_IRIPA|nr:cysteine proteinase 1-like [Iris pallida]